VGNSNQTERWFVAALLDIELRLEAIGTCLSFAAV
jgi:hypothetical protein